MMAHPTVPWYSKLEEIVAPTETASTTIIVAIIVISLFVLWKGNAVHKAALAVWLVSP